MTPVISVSATMNTMAGRICFNMTSLLSPDSSNQVQGRDHEVDRLDADERNDDAAKAINQQITLEQRPGPHGAIPHALERKRNEGDDDQRIEDDRREDGALRTHQVHDVEGL